MPRRAAHALSLVTAIAVLAGCGSGGSSADSPGDISIPELQGPTAQSSLAGQVVVVTGVVTGDFQDLDADTENNLGGFYLQDPEGDGDDATSDGVFVYGDEHGVDVAVGDRVEVRGQVSEHFGETQLIASDVTVVGRGHVAPRGLALPAAATMRNADGVTIADLEPYEGMLVSIPGPLTVIDAYELEPFGAVQLSASGRRFQFTNQNLPDGDGYGAHRRAFARATIMLDDGLRKDAVSPPRYLRSDAGPLRVGDEFSDLVGVLRYARGSGSRGLETWRLVPVGVPRIRSANPRPVAPERVGGSIRVMSFNALNFFPTVDSGVPSCGPQDRFECRGADSNNELARQQAKLVSAVAAADVHIIGLMEIENDSGESLALLSDALNDAGAGAWQFVDTGIIGDDAIKVGLLFRGDAVVASGEFKLLDSRTDPRFDDARNRPVLLQTFMLRSSGAQFSVAVNHLKSKGSPCDDAGDSNSGDGQGNCNETRTRAARALADWLATDPTASNDADVLIIGDLNAYRREDPLVALETAGFVNLLGNRPDSYSFVFRGESGALDHALASPSLAAQVTGVTEWHINADEAPLHDYNLDNGRDPSIFEANPFRASDHDPVIVGLDPVAN